MQSNDRLNVGDIIGIIGGGQLGKMMAHSVAQFGFQPLVYDPDPNAPATHVAKSITASWDDYRSLDRFSKSAKVVGYEFENIPKSTLLRVSQHVSVYPHPSVAEICSNRGLEKRFLSENNLNPVPYRISSTIKELEASVKDFGYDAIIKSMTGGYDGKNQIWVANKDQLNHQRKLLESMMVKDSVIVEKRIDFLTECSLIIGRTNKGDCQVLPLTKTIHKDGILRKTYAPLSGDKDCFDSIVSQTESYAWKIATALDLVGILTIEMFITKDCKIYINELAPRPHNSGHWSMNSGGCCQFELWLRCIVGLALRTDQNYSAVEMINLIGEEVQLWTKWLVEPAHIHLYGKLETRPNRKMGHINLLHKRPSFSLFSAIKE